MLVDELPMSYATTSSCELSDDMAASVNDPVLLIVVSDGAEEQGYAQDQYETCMELTPAK